MLVLSRNENESIVISSPTTGEVYATVTVTDIDRAKVKIGVCAGPQFAVHRREIYEEIHGPVESPVCRKSDRPISVKATA